MQKSKKICVVGAGYVGLVTGACLAEIGHAVICVDKDREKIKKLEQGIMPIYEPGLENLVAKNVAAKRLSFSTDTKASVRSSQVIFIAVATPTKKYGGADLAFFDKATQKVGCALKGYKVIVNKSTVPIGTGKRVKETILRCAPFHARFDVVSNPEFLREGSAIRNFLSPDRIIIGAESKKAQKIMRDIYASFAVPIIMTDIATAETIKYACNAFLATKISFINAIATICERTGANVDDVALSMGFDERIGKSFLKAGLGFGGSCLPKDIDAFCFTSRQNGYRFSLLEEVKKINHNQRSNFLAKIQYSLGTMKGKTVGVWGLSFKPDTDDVRDAPAIDIIKDLIKNGAKVIAYDPIAIPNAKLVLPHSARWGKDMYTMLSGVDALIIMTDWDIFKRADLKKIKEELAFPLIIDGRNIFNPLKMKRLGFSYHSIGR